MCCRTRRLHKMDNCQKNFVHVATWQQTKAPSIGGTIVWTPQPEGSYFAVCSEQARCGMTLI